MTSKDWSPMSPLVRRARRAVAPLRRRWRDRRRDALVMPAYYAAQVGGPVRTRRDSTRHYLDEGWRRGLLPHPFVGDDAPRHDLDAARRLREDVARATRRSGPRPTPPDVSRLVDLITLTRSRPEAMLHPLGPAGHLLDAPPKTVEKLPVTRPSLGDEPRTVRWSAYLSELADRSAAVPEILRSGAFEPDHYAAQTGHQFLSPEAALAHYLDVGEPAGHAPHRFVEPEWLLEHHADTMAEPVLMSYWRSDQTASASPHFDGRVHVDLRCGGTVPPEGAFAHFLALGPDPDAPTPAAPGVAAATRSRTGATVTETVRAIVEDGHTLTGTRPAPPSDASATDGAVTSSLDVAVVVDARSMHPSRPFTTVLEQTHAAVRVLVVVPHQRRDVVVSEAALTDLQDLDRVEVVRSGPGETYGATVRRAVGSTPAVVFWSPAQRWDPEFLSQCVAALEADASVAAVVTGAVPRWLTSADPVWSPLELAVGIVVRPGAVEGGIADAGLDAGVEWDLLLRLDPTTVRTVPTRLVRPTSPGRRAFDLQEPRRWANVVLSRHLDRRRATPAPRVAGRISILMPTFEDWVMTLAAVRSVLDSPPDDDLEVVVLDNGSRPAVSRVLTAALAGEPRAAVVRMPRNTDFALGSNLALAASTGEFAVFLNNDTTALAGSVRALVAALEAGAAAAQPLLLYPSGTVQAAGVVFLGQAVPPVNLLANHPAEDVHPALADVDFHALTAACLAMRATDAVELGGFDPVYVNGMEDVDLCLRLRALGRGPLRLVPSAVVVHHESQSPGRFDRSVTNRTEFVHRWRDQLTRELDDRSVLDGTHLRFAGVRSTRQRSERAVRRSELQVSRPSQTVAAGPAAGLPRLRWAIKTAIAGIEEDHRWGDRFFADDLAAALGRLGQEVVVDRRPAAVRPESDHLDDVTLTLRGLAQFQPQPDTTNLLWIISHPDAVSDAELANGWDRVYAAGGVWAEDATSRTGVPVQTLLQATAPERFTPGATGPPELAHDVLFVGNTRRVFRPIVRDAVAAGADLAIYGDGWLEYVDPRHVRADRIANQHLPAAYASSRVVLNDHWADMAANGFISNRLFDAAAAGARIVTDRVTGLEEVFGPHVRVYDDVDDLRTLLDPDDAGWPSAQERGRLAEDVAAHHSFDARALRLLADVLDTRGVAHALPTEP